MSRGTPDRLLPDPAPAPTLLADDAVELRLLRVLGPGDEAARPPAARFLARVPECRFAVHRCDDDTRVGRIHLRLTDDPDVVRAVGHAGYEIDEPHRRHGYAARALQLIRRLARHYGVAPLWVLVEPENTASRRTAERAGLRLVDVVPTAPEARGLGLGPVVCRYAAALPDVERGPA